MSDKFKTCTFECDSKFETVKVIKLLEAIDIQSYIDEKIVFTIYLNI